ncbi:C6 finger domain-containing protein [Purpureocillium lavendulum]|uniref:C6 finger domain-containing protein n=1 Tax=Purpureocillium lavendulum TaxID=1247861 RepID=A0AB34G575_9HYPO|nr:C6 finger domain-containing protein [Purpureocillium lavendulum]
MSNATLTGFSAAGLDGHNGAAQQQVSWSAAFALALVAYASACSFLRFRRFKDIHGRFPYPDRASLSRMTNEDAQAIVHSMSSWECPLFFDLGLRYALFKTYAVDSIASLLVAVSDLAQPDQAPKRYEDTEIIFVAFAQFHPNSPLLHQAVGRMNYLHAPYIKSGKITNEDLVYVLYTAMVEPIRFFRLYEWRAMSEMEEAAQCTLWKYVGDMMEINYAAVLGKNQWRDALEFRDDVTRWACKYEEDHVRPSAEVERLGEVLIDLLLSAYPKAARPLGYQLVLVLLGEKLRYAFRLPEPGVAVTAFAYSLLLLRKLFLRFLALPRRNPLKYLSDAPDPKTGRMSHNRYLKEPWYTPATWSSRWGPVALATRAYGGIVPGDKPELKPEGFLWEDVGPRGKMGKGAEESANLGQRAGRPIQGRTSTTTAAPGAQMGGPYPTSLREGDASASYEHPPGYQQDVHASEFSSSQRAAHAAAAGHDSGLMSSFGQDDQAGVWDAAKKWAAAAGESLAAAENEVWKRINKD